MTKLRKFFLSISTTSGVILFTMGFLSMLERENYWMAALLLLFAFWLPMQSGEIADRITKRSRPDTNDGAAADNSNSRKRESSASLDHKSGEQGGA
jgi:hypothetical protein